MNLKKEMGADGRMVYSLGTEPAAPKLTDDWRSHYSPGVPADKAPAVQALRGPTPVQRVGSGLGSIAVGTAGTPFMMFDTAKQSVKDFASDAQKVGGAVHDASLKAALARKALEDYQAKSEWRTPIQQTQGETLPGTPATVLTRYQYTDEYNRLKRALDEAETEYQSLRTSTPVSTDTTGMKLMGRAGGMRGKATEGLSPVGRFVGDTLISVGDSAATYATSLGNPAVAAGVMGAKAAARRAYELSAQGTPSDEALKRGVVSGIIEAVSEKIPFDMLADAIKGGKPVLANLLKQSGVEAAEEMASYIMDYAADVSFGDPNAEFSLQEMALSGAGGALSGAIMGGGSAVIGKVRGQSAPGSTDVTTPPAYISKQDTPVITPPSPNTAQAAQGLPTVEPRKITTPPSVMDRQGVTTPTSGQTIDVSVKSWDEINSMPQIQEARRRATFETPTSTINTPERQAIRNRITDDLMKHGSFSGVDASGKEAYNGAVRKERRADIVIGPPTAGKSSVLADPLSQEHGSRIIDSDMAKAMLPEFDGGFGAGRVHIESANISEGLMLDAALSSGDNIVIPWVGKDPEKLRKYLSTLKAEGYDVYLSLNELDPDKAARRAVNRFLKEGRFVDPDYVRSVGWKPSETYEILKREGGFDGYAKYSNDVEFGQPARLIERSERPKSGQVQVGGVGGPGGESRADNALGTAHPAAPGGATSGQPTDTLNDAPANGGGVSSGPDTGVAEVLTSAPGKNGTVWERGKQTASETYDYLARKLVDTGHTIDTMAKKIGDKKIYPLYNNAKQARQSAEYMIGEAQTDLYGNKVGESLKSIMDPIRAKGDDYFKDFSTYLFHRHNIDRMSLEERYGTPNKPVFGDGITALVSQNAAQQQEAKHPEYAQLAEQVYAYNRNLMEYRVQTGLVSRESADHMNEMYPHYVPTFRDNPGTAGAKATGSRIQIIQGVKKATGSNRNLLPIDRSMAHQTMQTVQAGKRNLVGNQLLNDALNHGDKLAEYVQTVQDSDAAYDIDADTSALPELRNSFVVYQNGTAKEMTVNNGIAEGMKALAYVPKEQSTALSAVATANNTFKRLVTGDNPFFLLRNFSRDLQDALLYTKDLPEFAKKYPKAWTEMATNGEMWQKYQALGGTGSTFFDYDTGIAKEPGKVGKALGKLETLNLLVEQAPRFSEFMATLEKGDGSYQNMMDALYNAADVTVNFGRSGTWSRELNRYLVPFFNPGVQGADKMIRRVTETKGSKEWMSLALRAAVLGIGASLFNALLYKDDEEYKLISDREKDNNYLLKLKDGAWFRIPKGRVLSVIGGAARRGLENAQGEGDGWADIIEVAKLGVEQTAPVNPVTNNFLSPLIDASNNKTWYGGNIESQRLQKYRPGERYDESTDALSKAIGGAINVSPKKINYVLDAYTGVVGDVALPLMTPKAERNPAAKAFIVDPVLQNRLTDDFFKAIDNLTYDKNGKNPTPGSDVALRYLNYQSRQASDVYERIRKVENMDLSGASKREYTRSLRDGINEIQKTALDTLPKYQAIVAELYPTYRKDPDTLYREANRKALGAEYALKAYNKNVYEKARDAKGHGVSYEDFYRAYFAQQGIEGDGTALSASKKKKEAIDSSAPALEPAARRYLYEQFGVSKKTW